MFLKKRWSLLLLKHRRQTAKFQFGPLLWVLNLIGNNAFRRGVQMPPFEPPKGFIVKLYQIRSTNGGQGAQRDVYYSGFCAGAGKGSICPAGKDHRQPERFGRWKGRLQGIITVLPYIEADG